MRAVFSFMPNPTIKDIICSCPAAFATYWLPVAVTKLFRLKQLPASRTEAVADPIGMGIVCDLPSQSPDNVVCAASRATRSSIRADAIASVAYVNIRACASALPLPDNLLDKLRRSSVVAAITASTATISSTDSKAAPRSEGLCAFILQCLFQRSGAERVFVVQPGKACVARAFLRN